MNPRPQLREPEAVGFPAIERAAVRSGVRILALPRHDTPFVSLHIVLRSGAERDPAGRPGLAALSADMLEAGAGTMGYQDIAREVDSLGATMNTATTPDGSVISLSFLSGHLPGVLNLLGTILSAPTFPTDEFERRRARRLHQIVQQKDSPSALAHRVFSRAVYGPGHPYGTEPPGTEESLKAMAREECTGFAGREYVPGAAFLIAVGDVRTETLQPLVEESFRGWKPQPVPADPSLPAPVCSPGSVIVVDRPGAAQSEIRMGRPALSRSDDDVFPAIVLNRVLGGQFTSRLNAVLREQKGLTYGIRSSFSFTRKPGPFMVATSVDTARTAEALETLEVELHNVAGMGITADEQALAKRGITGGFALSLEHHAQVAGILDTIVLHDLPDDYYDRYLSRIQAVSLHDTTACARRWVDPAAMTTVVVGDAKALRDSASPSLLNRVQMWNERTDAAL